MGVDNYNLTASSFRGESTRDYELSILSGVDSFAYIIRDRSHNHLLAYRSYTFSQEERSDWPTALAHLIEGDERLRGSRYGSILLAWDTPAMALVPNRLYDESQPAEYLDHLTHIGLDHAIRSEAFNELGSTLVFAVDRQLVEAAEQQLLPLRTHHFAGGVLTAWALRSRRIGHRSVSASIRGNRLLVAAHRSGVLEFYNIFSFANVQDALYYLLLVYQQCGWSPNRVPLYLCGEVTEQGELYQQYYRYVEDIRFSQYGAPPSVPTEMAGLPAHLYFELLCLG